MRTTHLAWPVAIAALALTGCSETDAPTDHQLSETTQLVQYGSCGQLETDLENSLIRETWANIDQYGQWGGAPEAGADSGGGTPTGGDRTEGQDYSGTNNQETGVDEADLVKTDGYHVYALNGSRLHIFGVPQFGELTPESETSIEGQPREMLLDKVSGRAVVFSYVYVQQLPAGHPLRALTGVGENDASFYWRADALTKMTVLDVSDRTHPTLVREVYYEGWYQTARKVDASVRVSTYASINNPVLWDWWQFHADHGENKAATKAFVASRIHALTLADLTPQMFVRTPNGQFTVQGLSQGACQSFYRPTDSHARGIASIISFDLLGANLAFDADNVVSNWATFYASQDKLVLAEPAHDWWWYWWFQDDPDQLNVHVFDISQPGTSRYVGSGRVDGQLSDQFAIDEEAGAIRLATTTNIFRQWWGAAGDAAPPVMENHVWVLEPHGARYDVVGHVGGIAPGERIMSARLIGDKGYLVTFRQTDPLFTLDLSDNTDPHVVGELVVPGFSTYIHPLAADRLLTIGVGGDANGANWRTTVATFDVGDFAHPALTQALPVEGEQGWGWSEALWEHKAFQYFAPKKLLAIPQSNHTYDGVSYRYLSQLKVINVDDATGAMSIKGTIDHSAYFAPDQWWSSQDIRRSIFMGDYLYAFSDKAITVHRLSDLGQVTMQSLPGSVEGDWYWWW